MTQVWVEQQATLPQAFDAVFDALLCALPRLGLRVQFSRREQGMVVALVPHWKPADQIHISVFRVEADQTCVTVQCLAPRPARAVSIALRRKSARQILAVLEQNAAPQPSEAPAANRAGRPDVAP